MPRPNFFYVIVSLALVLFLLGLVGVWTFQADYLARQLQENLDIIVELQADHLPAERETLITNIRAARWHKPGTEPVYISHQQALQDLDEAVQQDLQSLGINNPLLDVVTFHVPLAQMSADSLARIAAEVRQFPAVSGIFYQENFLDRIASNIRRLGLVLISLAALFTLVAGLLIHNTVRLSLYANRFTIKTQELVGASWGFISRPYLKRSLWQGMISGLLAITGVVGIQYWLNQWLPELQLFAQPALLLLLYGSLLLLGICINFVSHYVVVRRYLRLRLDDLY